MTCQLSQTGDVDRNGRPLSYQIAINDTNPTENGTEGFGNISPSQELERDTRNTYDATLNRSVFNNLNDHYNCNSHEKPKDAKNTNDRDRKDGSFSSASSKTSLLSRTSAKLSRNKCVVFIVSIQITLFVVFISFITVMFVMLFDLKRELENTASDSQAKSSILCLPCNDLILGPLDEDNQYIKTLTRRLENGVEVCCAEGGNQTAGIIELLFQRREKLHNTQDIIESESNCKCNSTGDNINNDRKIAGHMLVGMQPPTHGTPPYTVHNWIQSASVAHSNGIQVQDSRVIVNTSGLYFVYSQILFSNLYNNHAPLNATQALYHYVYRWNIIYPNGGTELLLKSVRTQCWAENRVYGDYTSYTAGVFTLSAGDHLFVKVSKIDSISRDSQASFFGVAKM